MHSLSATAIDAAISRNWKKAIELNETILSHSPSDVDALSRLAFAYTQLRKIDRARQLYRKILNLDRYNIIAQKNLDKLNSIHSKASLEQTSISTPVLPNLFIEEPGKTKSVILKNIAPFSILSKLHICDTVQLFPKRHSIEVRDGTKTYLGALPDDIAFRLLRFLKSGNTYHVCIKNIAKNSATVFIRELTRGKRFATQPTFLPTNRDFSLSVPKELKKDRGDTGDDGESQDESDEE